MHQARFRWLSLGLLLMAYPLTPVWARSPSLDALGADRIDFRQAFRRAFIQACQISCASEGSDCVERCVLRPFAEIAAEDDDDPVKDACENEGGAFVARLPDCGRSIAELLDISSIFQNPRSPASHKRIIELGGADIFSLLLAASAQVGRYCSPEMLCTPPVDSDPGATNLAVDFH